MAHRLPCRLLASATVLLLLAGAPGNAQQSDKPKQPSGAPEKQAEPAPAAKEQPASKVDVMIEKAFGSGCKELQRPLRLWIPARGLALAAGEFTVDAEGLIRLTPFSVALFGVDGMPIQEARGDSAVIKLEAPITGFSGLATGNIIAIDVDAGGGFKFSFPTRAPKGDKAIVAPVLGPPPEIRFKFRIEPGTALADLLPVPPKILGRLPLWTNEDLSKVTELTFGEPIFKELSKHRSMEKTAHIMAKINHLNATKRDGFMLAMIDKRSDLRGLPFLMGDDCRTREEQAKIFAFHSSFIRSAEAKESDRSIDIAEKEVWSRITSLLSVENRSTQKLNIGGALGNKEQLDRSLVASLTQIMMPESEQLRVALARFLAMVPNGDATKALARLAIFSPEDEVRAAAIDGLKLRREKDYTDVLLQGFRYPLPAVSKRAAEALVKLERKDLIANLVEVLESPDPRLPVTQKRDGNTVTFVRELVKVNHHRNCLLCHAPGNTADTPEGVLKVAVPLPGEPLPKPSEGGYQSTPPPSPDIVVRLDMTYLRQDFSVMMPVADAHPWPEMQRFDFLVRTRELTASEAQAYEPCCDGEEEGRLSPYHRAALFALRELTGRDTAPTAAAWRKLLKLTAR